MDRLVALNRNMYGSTYVPFHNDDDYDVSQVKDNESFSFYFINFVLQKSETYAREISREDSRRDQVGGEKLSAKYKSTLTVEIWKVEIFISGDFNNIHINKDYL